MFSELQKIKTMLLSVTENVYHYTAPKQDGSYIVWAEDMESNAILGDNKKQNQIIQGTIDLYTKEEFDPRVQLIQQGLNQNEVSFVLNSIQHEEETGYIHFEWLFEVVV